LFAARLVARTVQRSQLLPAAAVAVFGGGMSGGSVYPDIISFSQDHHQPHISNHHDIDANYTQLLGYAGASSLTPEQRQHSQRILVARERYEGDAFVATPPQILPPRLFETSLLSEPGLLSGPKWAHCPRYASKCFKCC